MEQNRAAIMGKKKQKKAERQEQQQQQQQQKQQQQQNPNVAEATRIRISQILDEFLVSKDEGKDCNEKCSSITIMYCYAK